MEILGVKEFKLPGITEESVTEEQFNELMKKLSKVSFQLQEINDTLDGRVLSANIHNESIRTRHLYAESVTTEKLVAGEIVLATIAEDFNWSTLVDDGNKPDDNADVTGDNTAADIINLPATPSVAGLYASGTYLGYHDGSNWKAYIQNDGKFYFTGDANNYVQWNGSSLTIKGTITLLNTIDWQTNVAGTGKPDDYADVTLAAIQGELSLAGGGLVLASAGAKIRGGQTAYETGTGFWLGDDSGTFKFSIGSSTQYLKWTGSVLSISGSITLINTIPNAKVDGLGDLALQDTADWQTDIAGTGKPDDNADVTLSAIQGELSLAGGGLVLASAGAKIRGGQTAYETGTGFWLGDDSGTFKFSIGSTTNYLKWTGSALEIKGRLSVGADTNEDVYFEDSGIRMYDSVSGDFKNVHFKYNTLDFAKLLHLSTTSYASWTLCTSSHSFSMIIGTDGATGLDTSGAYMYIRIGATPVLFYHMGTGQFGLPNLGSDPVSNLAVGQLASVNGVLKFYDGAWKTVTIT